MRVSIIHGLIRQSEEDLLWEGLVSSRPLEAVSIYCMNEDHTFLYLAIPWGYASIHKVVLA